MTGRRDTAAALALDMAKRRLTITEGGEQVGTFAVAQLRRAGTAYGRSWTIAFQDAAFTIAAADLSPAAHRLAWWALAALHPREWTRCSAAEIGDAFGWHRSTASRAMAELAAAGVIERDGRDAKAYRLSLALAWQGTVAAYHKERRRAERVTRLRLPEPAPILPGWRQADHAETAAEKGAGATQRAAQAATAQRGRPRQVAGRVKP